MNMQQMNTTGKPCIAVITNHDDDLYYMRLELVRPLTSERAPEPLPGKVAEGQVLQS